MSDITRLQILLASLKGEVEFDYSNLTKQVPFRIRSDLFARLSAVNAIASMKKKVPRNNILNDLLEIALDQVESEADSYTASEIRRLTQCYLEMDEQESSKQEIEQPESTDKPHD